jgi:putative membrane protein
MMDWADGGSSWSWWWMLPMMMFMVLLVGAVIWAVIAATRSGNNALAPSSQRTAEDILNERYARGEIDSAEYRERIDALHSPSPAKH